MTDDHRSTGTGWPAIGVPRPSVPADDPTAVLAAAPDPDQGPTAPDDDPTVAMSARADPAPSTAVADEPAAVPAARDGATVAGTAGTAGIAGTEPPEPEPPPAPPAGAAASRARRRISWRRLSGAGTLIGVLLALFGFTLAVQLRSNDTDEGLSTARQEDLVRILSDLEAREQRLIDDIAALEEAQRQLASGVQGRQAALAEAERRANELGLLAGTLPARGPGLRITISPGDQPIKASAILNTVQELRGAGGEVMQLAGGDGSMVRVVASTAFVDIANGVQVGDARLSGPYVLTVIGDPQTMHTALNIPGGVVTSVGNAGGTVIVEEHDPVEVTATRDPTELQYARPVS